MNFKGKQCKQTCLIAFSILALRVKLIAVYNCPFAFDVVSVPSKVHIHPICKCHVVQLSVAYTLFLVFLYPSFDPDNAIKSLKSRYSCLII